MYSYNDDNHAWQQRIRKEIWAKEELRDFGQQVNGDTLRDKYTLKVPEG